MSWSGGTFSRIISGGWTTDKVTTPAITAVRHDTNDDDLATGINACVEKTGSNLGTSTFYDNSTLGVSGGKLIVKDAGIGADQLAAAVAGDGLAGGAGTAFSVNVDDSTIEISSDTLQVKDSGIVAAKLAAAVAGAGLAGGGGSALSVNVDNSTIEINSDTLRVKADGINGAKIANDSIDSEHYVDGSIDNQHVNFASGTWTPVLRADGSDVLSTSSAEGVYLIIGDLVFLYIDVTTTEAETGIRYCSINLPSQLSSDTLKTYIPGTINQNGTAKRGVLAHAVSTGGGYIDAVGDDLAAYDIPNPTRFTFAGLGVIA